MWNSIVQSRFVTTAIDFVHEFWPVIVLIVVLWVSAASANELPVQEPRRQSR